jgi:phytanoyl-CoA hydroxylase
MTKEEWILFSFPTFSFLGGSGGSRSQMMNSEAIRKAFHRDGFVVIEGFFDENYLARLEAAMNRYVAEVAPALPPDQVFYENGQTGAIKSMNRLDEHDPFFAAFKTQASYVDLVAEIFETAPREIISESLQFFGKPAYEGSVTPWHQNNGFQHYAPPESLMIWLALDGVDEENGCVVFARGSHGFRTRLQAFSAFHTRCSARRGRPLSRTSRLCSTGWRCRWRLP